MFIASNKELGTLRSALEADTAQFIAVYGIRCVGKTVLVREAFGGSFTFAHAGVSDGSFKEQIFAFSDLPASTRRPVGLPTGRHGEGRTV